MIKNVNNKINQYSIRINSILILFIMSFLITLMLTEKNWQMQELIILIVIMSIIFIIL